MGTANVGFTVNFYRIKAVGTTLLLCPWALLCTGISQHAPCGAVTAKPLRVWCEIIRALA